MKAKSSVLVIAKRNKWEEEEEEEEEEDIKHFSLFKNQNKKYHKYMNLP